MGFSRQESWSGSPFSSPGGLSDPRIKAGSPALHVESLLSELLGKPCAEVAAAFSGLGAVTVDIILELWESGRCVLLYKKHMILRMASGCSKEFIVAA